ncbi:MAG: hypothetical protein JAY99_01105 [Candidatus Thiodiazotropha lotti]|uniref:hypothetical protein n=1 Tax=Candidatus Thiodiazotropha endoloripes TaxID=1818881 RepID=UPI00083D9ACF|nr:hypothetical protein [Candidatus Thiodiazotropha endoloripes]MCG7993384.1 hypothetical protein [Candidatus Thiodiazotropha lotti]MCW4185046.1 hypothetical protein [Candidatus Thiodiazotropha weberae]MCG7998098.1 hypothetical protein [Candidatus Thiodiazotropha lotti]MCW4189863.1 hypothetical protein [Candidatus Thiodiazotropha weberae]ODB84684.1 hypothetical protein A3193_18090 [Candidatus Thiodiazotropha endoloripes]
MVRLLLVLTLIQLGGCSTERAKLVTYEALESQRHRQCMEQLDSRACDEQKQSYQEYQKEREQHLQSE